MEWKIIHPKEIWDQYVNPVWPKHSELTEKCQELSRHTAVNSFYFGLGLNICVLKNNVIIITYVSTML